MLTPRSYATATMYLGIVTTLGGNAAAADWSDPLGVIISTLPAAALFAVFEMVTRLRPVPSRRRWYHAVMRLVPAMVIMAIAAWVSFGHLYQVATAHGQHGLSAVGIALLPDAMMLLAAVVLHHSPAPRKSSPAAAAAKTAATRKAGAAKAAATRKANAAKTAAAVATPPVILPTPRRARQHLALLPTPS